jgi:CBS domain-containing protein
MDSTANISVSDIMQREVLTVENDWPLDQLARFLTDNQISGAPVIAENGSLLSARTGNAGRSECKPGLPRRGGIIGHCAGHHDTDDF